MHSLDFEEFLWAKGYDATFADDLLEHMRQQTPLNDAGIINICYCLNFPELPLKGNYEETKYKLYFAEAIIFTRFHTFVHFC